MKSHVIVIVFSGFLLAGCLSTPADTPSDPILTAVPTQAAIRESPASFPEPTIPTSPTGVPKPAPTASAAGWIKIEPGGKTRCAHGTPYAFWVRRGASDRLLVYFQGGGGCWDAETCAPGSTFYDDAVTSSDNPERRSGILDLSNPENPFKDYTIVYVPSCTGDVHWGDNVQTYTDADGRELTIYHRGFVNGSAALTWAYQNVTMPESIFVTGCSAGSVGSAAFVPYVIAQYPDASVTQLGDSLSFVFHRPLNLQTDYHTHDNFPGWIPALSEIEPGQFLMADYYVAIAGYYPDHTFSQYNTAHDNVQVRFYRAVGGQPGGFEQDLQTSLASIHERAPNFRSYTAGGSAHCILPLDHFYTYQVEGVRFRDWVDDLANGRDVENIHCVDCETVDLYRP